MKQAFRYLHNRLRGSILHPQWLTDRYHIGSRRCLRDLRNSLILDIGSGNSRNIEYIHESNTLIRLDYPEINRRYQTLPDIFGDARFIPVQSGSFDAVFLFEVLEHVAGYEKAITEIHRILKPRGKLFLSVPFIYPIHDAPYDFQRFTAHGINYALQAAGFQPTQVVQHGNSFLVAVQLLNLAILEGCRAAWHKHPLFGLSAAIATYPLCLFGNIVSVPFTLLPDKGASCFGYFVAAERA